MHRSFLVAVAALALGIVAGSQLARAGANDRTFTLEQHDKIIAEAPGCYASCQVRGTQRVCTVRESNCHATCRALPECRLDVATSKPLTVCVVIRDAPF